MTPDANAEWTPEDVRALRRRLALSQQELARALGVRQQTVSDWETGLHSPQGASRRMLELLAERPGEDAPRLRVAAEPRAPYGNGGGGAL